MQEIALFSGKIYTAAQFYTTAGRDKSQLWLQMGQMGPKMTLGTLTMSGDDFPGV